MRKKESPWSWEGGRKPGEACGTGRSGARRDSWIHEKAKEGEKSRYELEQHQRCQLISGVLARYAFQRRRTSGGGGFVGPGELGSGMKTLNPQLCGAWHCVPK